MVAIVERSITKANDIAAQYLAQLDVVNRAQERVNAERAAVLAAERAKEQAETEALLPALKLGKDGPINGANEQARKYQITELLGTDPDYRSAVLDLDQAKTDLLNAEATLQAAVNLMTAYRHLIQAAAAEMNLLAAHS